MKYYTITTAFYMFFIFYLSHIPQDNLPEQSSSGIENIDLLFHFIEYSVLGFLLFQSISSEELFAINPQYGTIFIGILFAISDEIHQSFVPGRHMSLMDVIFDSLGIIFGSSLVYRIPNSS